MQTTTNYGLRKPEYNETVDIADLNYNSDQIDSALTPTADPTLVYPDPMSNGPHKLEKWVSWLVKLIKAITGKANWWDAPVATIEELNSAVATKAAAGDLSAHLADKVTQGAHGFATTANILLYVRTDGNDSNDGSANDAAHALKTIGAAIAKIPQMVNHSVTINVASGTYNEAVTLEGYGGKGQIILTGGADLAASANYLISYLTINNCTCSVTIQGFRVTSNTWAFRIYSSFYCNVQYCSALAGAASYPGIMTYGAFVNIYNCEFSNKQYAISAQACSTVYSNANSGTGNSVGLSAVSASAIGKFSTQPGGTTAEYTSSGGVIR